MDTDQKKSGLFFKGLPYRGAALPLLKDSDPASARPQRKQDAHARVFDLSNEDDIKAYEKILSGAVNKTTMIGSYQVVYDNELHTFKVYVHWSDLFYVPAQSPTDK